MRDFFKGLIALGLVSLATISVHAAILLFIEVTKR